MTAELTKNEESCLVKVQSFDAEVSPQMVPDVSNGFKDVLSVTDHLSTAHQKVHEKLSLHGTLQSFDAEVSPQMVPDVSNGFKDVLSVTDHLSTAHQKVSKESHIPLLA